MKSVYQSSFRELETLRDRYDGRVLVGFSGGKDSLAVLDLCCKVFPVVRCFFKYMVPWLEVIESRFRWAKEKYGVEVVQFPSIGMLEAIQNGLWRDEVPLGIPEASYPLKVSFRFAQEACDCTLIATGMKNADGLKRRQFFANIRDGEDPFWNDVAHPIRDWRKKDVLDYLKVNGIPIPETEKGAVTSGVGLDHGSLCWLHDSHPADFAKLLKLFPYAEAAIKRREWYGIK